VGIKVHKLHSGNHLTLKHHDDESLYVVVGSGGGCTLNIEADVAGIWIPLRGALRLSGSNLDVVLRTRELCVTEFDTRMQATGRGSALWIVLLGTKHAWRRAFGPVWNLSALETILLPACYRIEREVRRKAATLARASLEGTSDVAAIVLIDAVLALQGELAHVISRCPGRTYAQRRMVFLRLQRVRNFLGSNCHLDLDNVALARMANYSPCHFLRTFHAVYQETPHAYLLDQRLQRARRLLRTSRLAITEVACASGFGNRCVFSRLFRKRFGTTAGAMRRESVALV
jgi:AraC family transcriptional regulator